MPSRNPTTTTNSLPPMAYPGGATLIQHAYQQHQHPPQPVLTALPLRNGAPPMMPVPANSGLMAAYLPGHGNTYSTIQPGFSYVGAPAPLPPQQQPPAPVTYSPTATASTTSVSHSSSWENQTRREIAASVLLLAAGGHDKKMKRDAGSTGSSDSNVPLKKRKMLTTTTTTNEHVKHTNTEDNASVRVSPVSHGSRSTLSPEHTHATTYEDSKHTPERSLPSQVVVLHLPSELYRLLEQDETKVIQWLPHGRGWRIVRWDALRKAILPQHFGGTSVDGFMAQLADWGFVEITDGEDAGAYYNAVSSLFGGIIQRRSLDTPTASSPFFIFSLFQFFRRGFPHLCKEMQYKPRGTSSPVKSPPTTNSSSPVDNKHASTPQTHASSRSGESNHTPSILQVPSLASPHESNTSPTSPPTTKRMNLGPGSQYTPSYPRGSPHSVGTYVSASGRPNMPFWFVDANQQAVLVQYRPSTDDRSGRAPSYSPVRVRSSRGRPSTGAVRRSSIVTPVRRMDDMSSTHSVGSSKGARRFPVSQRGRSRHIARTTQYVSATSSAGSTASHAATVATPQQTV